MNTLEWLRSLIILGHEDEDPYERDDDGEIVEDEGEKVLKEGWEFDADGKPVQLDPDDPDDKGGKDDEEFDDSVEGLKKALEASKKATRVERQARRKAERDAKRATKKKTEAKDEKDLEKTRTELEGEKGKTTRLATKLLDRSRDAAILAEARRQGFIDETDALTDNVRDEVDFDQEEDDPSDIDIDTDSVKDAVTALAEKKPHLVGKNSDGSSTTQSGSRMGKKKTGEPEKYSEEKLKTDYPSLNT